MLVVLHHSVKHVTFCCQ